MSEVSVGVTRPAAISCTLSPWMLLAMPTSPVLKGTVFSPCFKVICPALFTSICSSLPVRYCGKSVGVSSFKLGLTSVPSNGAASSARESKLPAWEILIWLWLGIAVRLMLPPDNVPRLRLLPPTSHRDSSLGTARFPWLRIVPVFVSKTKLVGAPFREA